MKKMNYTTIIVTYNRSKKLVQAVNSHLAQTIKPQKIIIVDNASTDGTNTLFESGGVFYKNDNILYQPLKSNIGGSGGFQVALEKALLTETDWVLFGDDDAYFDTDYVEKLYDKYVSLNSSEKIGVLTGTIKKFSTHDVELGSRSKIRNIDYVLLTPLTEEEYKTDTNIDVFTFVGPMIKTKVIQNVGNIHSDYFIHYDDSEFSLRIKERGFRSINVADAVVYHDSEGAKQLPIRDWRLYYDIRNRSHMMILHGKANKFFKTIAVVLLAMRTSKSVLIRKKPSNYHYNIMAVICGLRDAITQRLGKNEKFLP